MIGYMILDFLFGFTARRINRGNIPIEKAQSVYGYEDIDSNFKWLKKKFNLPNVRLFIGPRFDEVNAYAVGSMRGKSVTITMGLIELLKTKSENHTQYVNAVRAIMGHEMSHLANKDYLPGILTSANEAANRHVSKILRVIFLIFANCFRLIPVVGRTLYNLIIYIYNILNFIVNFFFKCFFMPVYDFIQKWLGRSVEYRCDRESSYAFGGESMALALGMLGKGSYFTIFSTHPGTQSRINYVQKVEARDGVIKPSIFNRLSNILSVLLVVFICGYSTHKTDVPGMYDHYMNEVYYPMKYKFEQKKSEIMGLYYRYKQ